MKQTFNKVTGKTVEHFKLIKNYQAKQESKVSLIIHNSPKYIRLKFK